MDVGSLAWASDRAGLARSSPAQPHGPGWAQPENKKNSFQKSVIFRKYFTAF